MLHGRKAIVPNQTFMERRRVLAGKAGSILYSCTHEQVSVPGTHPLKFRKLRCLTPVFNIFRRCGKHERERFALRPG